MDNIKMRFLKNILLLIANMALYLVFKTVGEFGRYKEFEKKLVNLERQYEKEWE